MQTYNNLPGVDCCHARCLRLPPAVSKSSTRSLCKPASAALHQSASDFLQRNHSLSSRGIRTHELGLDYLREGSAGPAVEELHTFLSAEGYMAPQDAASQRFYGPKTAQAVGRWQKDNGVLAAEKPGDFGHLSRQAYLSMLAAVENMSCKDGGLATEQEARAESQVQHGRDNGPAHSSAASQLVQASPISSLRCSKPAAFPILLAAGGLAAAAAVLLWRARTRLHLLNTGSYHASKAGAKEQQMQEEQRQQQQPIRSSPFQRSSQSLSSDRASPLRESHASYPPQATHHGPAAEEHAYRQQPAYAAAGQGQAQDQDMLTNDGAEGASDHLTTYLAAGGAMLMKTAASKGKPTGPKSKHTAGRELNPIASQPPRPSSRTAAHAASAGAQQNQARQAAGVAVMDVPSSRPAAVPAESAFKRPTPQGTAAGASASIVSFPAQLYTFGAKEQRPVSKGDRIIAGSIGGPSGLTAISRPATQASASSQQPARNGSSQPVRAQPSGNFTHSKPDTAAQAANVSPFGSYNPASKADVNAQR